MSTTLFFRIESTGLPKREAALDQQPRILRISAKLIDPARREMATLDALLRQDGYSISGGAARAKHGISDRDCVHFGIRPQAALATFMDMSRSAGALTTFNLDFASAMVEIEIARLRASLDDWRRSGLKRNCIMVAASQQLRGGKPISLDQTLEALEWDATRKTGLDAVDQVADICWELEFRRKTL